MNQHNVLHTSCFSHIQKMVYQKMHGALADLQPWETNVEHSMSIDLTVLHHDYICSLSTWSISKTSMY